MSRDTTLRWYFDVKYGKTLLEPWGFRKLYGVASWVVRGICDTMETVIYIYYIGVLARDFEKPEIPNDFTI